jgi:hypothetical protein
MRQGGVCDDASACWGWRARGREQGAERPNGGLYVETFLAPKPLPSCWPGGATSNPAPARPRPGPPPPQISAPKSSRFRDAPVGSYHSGLWNGHLALCHPFPPSRPVDPVWTHRKSPRWLPNRPGGAPPAAAATVLLRFTPQAHPVPRASPVTDI